jgi:pentatricopeptide repeat protein
MHTEIQTSRAKVIRVFNLAFKLVHEISNNGDFDSSHLKTIGIMMDMFCKNSMVNEAIDLLTRSLALDLPIDATMFNTLLHGIRKHGSEEDLLYYFELMKNCNLEPDATTVGIMVSYYGFEKKGLEKATLIHTESGIPDSRHSIGTFIGICLANNNIEEATKWYNILIKAGITPNSQILLSMMQLVALTSAPDKIISNGDKYFRVALGLEAVDQNICKGLAILNIASGKGIKESLLAFTGHILEFNVRPDSSSLLLFADAILRPTTFIQERARMVPLSMNVEENLVKVYGLAEFDHLAENIHGQITNRQREYCDLAKKYLL